MILLVLVLVAVIACSGGVICGYVVGRVHERVLAEARRPLAQLRGPIGVRG